MSVSTPVRGYDAAGNATSSVVQTAFQRDLLGFATAVTQGTVTHRYSLDEKRLLKLEYVPELGPIANGSTTQSTQGGALDPSYNVSYCRDDSGNQLGKAIGSVCSVGGSTGTVQLDTQATGSCTATSGTTSTPSTAGCGLPSPLFVNTYDDRNRPTATSYMDGTTPNVSIPSYTTTDKIKTLVKGNVTIEMDYDAAEKLQH
jgi:hypothetical protein